MQEIPLISIIINNYNYDRFLSQAIDSALNQTYHNLEVIVVDDGSTDHSRSLIANYGDRVIPVFKENGGQASAFNAGFLASKGDIILFLDADDFLLPSAAAQIAAAWKPELAKLHYRLMVVDEQGTPLEYSYPQGGHLSQGHLVPLLLNGRGYSTPPTSGNALNRKVLSKILPIPEIDFRIAADGYLATSVPFYGEIAAIEEPLGAYRLHGNNRWATATITGEKFRRFVQYDRQTHSLLAQRAEEFGYQLSPNLELQSFGTLWSRLASLRLDPDQHPIASDSSLFLTQQGIRALWENSNFNWQKRLIFSVWFLWVGTMPVPLAKLGITWLYAPQLRPKIVDKTLTTIRTLVS
jgi:glycosyltransferase involved in cell wall biosynthesis